MAELATIARPYAEALFKASSADLNGAAVWVEALREIAREAREEPELLKSAPHRPKVRRLDETTAARKPKLRY